ncbi:MAG: biotin--[acetyl-CoA-carboxylase] ligase [bacterium]
MTTDFKAVGGGGMWKARMLLFESLPSTNRWAMEHLGECRHGDIVVAGFQTAGRGRFERSWVCPAGRGLALSAVLCPPAFPADLIPATGFVAAIALLRTLAAFDINAMLKWPNDVVVDGRKISGILSEMDSATGAVVLGIGLNVNLTADDLLAAGLADTATSMLLIRKREYSPEVVAAVLLAHLEATFDGAGRKGFDALVREWAHHDWLTGHTVEIQGPHGPARGAYDGIDSTGALRLLDSSGNRQVFTAGDITRLRKT